MNYEKNLELCEYNPISVQYEKEVRELARVLEAPVKSFFQRLLKKITISHAAKA